MPQKNHPVKSCGDVGGHINLSARGISQNQAFRTGGTLTITGNITIGSGVLTLDTSDTNSSLTGNVSGSGGIELFGQLNVNNLMNAGPIILHNGGILGGTGTANGNITVQNGGTVAPGQSPGLLTVNGDQVFENGSTFAIEVNGTTVGSQYDQLAVNGTVTIGPNVTLSHTTGNGFVPIDGNSFTIIKNDGTDLISGTFTGLPEGCGITNFLGSGTNAFINYASGVGNDLLNGGLDTDTVVDTGNVNFTLTNTLLTGLGTDSLTSVERAGLTGGTGNNTLNAAAFTLGSVTLKGGDGNDTLTGSNTNNDLLDSGNGSDVVIVTGTGKVILMDTPMPPPDATVTVNGTTDGLISVEGISVTGGTGNDTLDASGFSGNVTLNGVSGNDSIIGGAGNDVLYGGAGNDTLCGNGGNDVLRGAGRCHRHRHDRWPGRVGHGHRNIGRDQRSFHL